MKKIFLLVFMLTLVFIFSSNSQEKTTLVFNDEEYINNYDHDYFYLTSKTIQLNTNNLSEYFNSFDIKIMGVYPQLNKIYDENLKKRLGYYSFSQNYSIDTNINNFINKYVSLLKNNNYIEEGNMVYFNGIDIETVLIYSSYNSIYEHNLKYHDFDYKVKEF